VPEASASADGSGDSRSDPATLWWLMLDTSTVELQEAPPLVLEAPPPDTRPTWNAETIVLPAANVSGSTSVLC
jgi:hypothetical protein